MTKKLLFVVTLLCALTFGLMAADITGKWTSETPGRNGGAPRVTTYTFSGSGASMTGKMEAPGRGGDVQSTDLKDVKVDGNNISFSVTRPGMGGGDPVTTKYTGTINGDTIELKFSMAGRDGSMQERTATLKKATT